MNVKLFTKKLFIERGGEKLNELDDKTKVASFIKLPKSVNDYTGDKGQSKKFKFSSVDDDMFDDKSSSLSHFSFSFNQPKGMKAMGEFYDDMLPSVDYSGELPESYKYKLNKGKTTNDRIADKLRENALDEDATLLPEAQELYPQIKIQKGEAFERFKSQYAKYEAEKKPTMRIEEGEGGGGGEGPPPEIEIKPVKKYIKETAEERQAKLRAEKMEKLGNEINENLKAENIQKVFRGKKARHQTEIMKIEKIKHRNENLKAENIQKVFRGHKARQETEIMKNEKIKHKNALAEGKTTDTPNIRRGANEMFEGLASVKENLKKSLERERTETPDKKKETKMEKKKEESHKSSVDSENETSDTASQEESEEESEGEKEKERENETRIHFNEARKLKNEVDALMRETDKNERNKIDAPESILEQYELLKEYKIISKKNKSNKLSKIWEKLDENVKLNEWIQKIENEKLLKKQELRNQPEGRQSERLARKSKKEIVN